MAPPRISGVLDIACTVDPSGARTSPPFASPLDRNNQTCSPDLEVVADIEEGDWHLAADFLIGENALYTQPVGLQSQAPIDLFQAFAEYRGPHFFAGFGRQATWMHFEVARPTERDFITPDTTFGMVPFTEIRAWGGYRTEGFELKLGVGPGPDQFAENNGVPYGMANLTATPADGVKLFANYHVGPVRDNNNSDLRHSTDFGLSLDPSPEVNLKFYGLAGTEEFDAGPKAWYGAVFYLGVRPEEGPVRLVLRTGYSQDDGARTGVDHLRIFGVTAGVNYYLFGDRMQLRLQVQHLLSTNDRTPFDGRTSMTRVGAQLVAPF